MFKKNDPLIDSVKAVMERNAIERQAEAVVNEEFGITSKNALPHEMRSIYEQRLAEAKKCMEDLKGDQWKLDHNKNNKIEADDLHKVRKHGPVKGKEIEEAKEGTIPKSDKDKNLASLAEPKHLITHKDVLKGRGVIPEKWKEELEEKKDYKLVNPGLEKKAKEKEEKKEIKEGTLSYKAARAGKDIGKKGKMFAKIASKAGERYGSEEKGKKVAGAILAKMRKKRGMEEEATVAVGNKPTTTPAKGAAPAGSLGKKKVNTVSEKTLTEPEKAKKEELVKKMKGKGFEERYPGRGEEVMYATATKMAKKLAEQNVFEEIQTKLEEQLLAIYESGDEAAFETFVTSLTEEQLQLLNLDEVNNPVSNLQRAWNLARKVNPADIFRSTKLPGREMTPPSYPLSRPKVPGTSTAPNFKDINSKNFPAPPSVTPTKTGLSTLEKSVGATLAVGGAAQVGKEILNRQKPTEPSGPSGRERINTTPGGGSTYATTPETGAAGTPQTAPTAMTTSKPTAPVSASVPSQGPSAPSRPRPSRAPDMSPGDLTRASFDVGGAAMGRYGKTGLFKEAEIKESFENFLRNKFLKG